MPDKPCLNQRCQEWDMMAIHNCHQHIIRSCQNYIEEGEEMKRYRLDYETDLFEDGEGTWVRWEDVKEIIDYSEQKIKPYTGLSFHQI